MVTGSKFEVADWGRAKTKPIFAYNLPVCVHQAGHPPPTLPGAHQKFTLAMRILSVSRGTWEGDWRTLCEASPGSVTSRPYIDIYRAIERNAACSQQL